MKNIPQSRIILYLLIIGLLPIVFAITNFFTNLSEFETLQEQMNQIYDQAYIKEKKQSQNMTIRKHYQHADHFYIDKQLETLSFLQPEIDALQTIIQNKYFAGDEIVKKRLETLTGPDNHLLFSEGNILKYPFFQETTATLTHPVEMNLDDLKKFLSLIEGRKMDHYQPGPNRPQLIITDFKMEKKEVTDQNDVFVINMKLLKREYQNE